MADPDDGFGPSLSGGGGGRVRAPEAPRTQPSGDGFGPPQRGRSRRLPRLPGRRGRSGGRRRIGRTLLLALLVLLLVVAATGTALALTAMSKMNRVDVDSLQSAGSQMNILVVGSDTREGMTRRQRRRLGTGGTEGARTDTIMLLSVRGGKAAMLSFPRDLFVQRCDGESGRINTAYGVGGPSCLVQTVTDLSGIPISHYMEVNFLGFANIVDAVDGVQMCLENPISDRDAHIDLDAGCQNLNGPQALGFVRVRKIDDDLGRIGRQQQFIKALAKEVAAPSTVLNVPRLFSTSNAIAGALTVDRGMGPIDLGRLAWAGSKIGGSAFPTFSVPATPAFVGGASVLDVSESEARPLFRSFADGSVLDRAGGELAPEDVEVVVSNGTNIAGLADRGRDLLVERGFVVPEIGNADRVGRTVIRHTRGNRPQAEVLRRELGDSVTLERTESGPPVELILGPDAPDLVRP